MGGVLVTAPTEPGRLFLSPWVSAGPVTQEDQKNAVKWCWTISKVLTCLKHPPGNQLSSSEMPKPRGEATGKRPTKIEYTHNFFLHGLGSSCFYKRMMFLDFPQVSGVKGQTAASEPAFLRAQYPCHTRSLQKLLCRKEQSCRVRGRHASWVLRDTPHLWAACKELLGNNILQDGKLLNPLYYLLSFPIFQSLYLDCYLSSNLFGNFYSLNPNTGCSVSN